MVESWIEDPMATAISEKVNASVRVTREAMATSEYTVAVTTVTVDEDGGMTVVTVGRHVPVEALPNADAGAALVETWVAPAIERVQGRAALSVEFAEAMAEAAAKVKQPDKKP